MPKNPLTSHSVRNAVREAIHAAFANTAMPERPLVRNPDGWEEADIERAFGGRQWTEVDLHTLEHEHAALSYFTPEAFRYYAPAFMLGDLVGWRPDAARGGPGGGWIVYSLAPPKKLLHQPDFHERMRGFTPPQTAAIRQYLEYMHARSPDANVAYALRAYWEK
jgi:hypothetical protein